MIDHEYATLAASGLDAATAYRLLTSAVVPRPIAWITTRSHAGVANAAPFSSYNYVAHSPPMLAVNISTREGDLKDTARNIVETGEFVVNVATSQTLEAMHASSADYPFETSELEALGIATLPSQFVSPPRVVASPIHMECRLERALKLGSGVNTLYIGEVVAFHISKAVFDGRYIDSVGISPIARLGGPRYAALGEILERVRPTAPPSTGMPASP